MRFAAHEQPSAAHTAELCHVKVMCPAFSMDISATFMLKKVKGFMPLLSPLSVDVTALSAFRFLSAATGRDQRSNVTQLLANGCKASQDGSKDLHKRLKEKRGGRNIQWPVRRAMYIACSISMIIGGGHHRPSQEMIVVCRALSECNG